METNNSRRPNSGRRPYSGSGGGKPTNRPSFNREGGGGDRRRSGTRRPSSASRFGGGGRPSSSRGGGSKRKQPTFDPSQFINKNPVEAKTEAYVPKHTFKDFKLGGLIVANVEKLGIETPSPIQDQIIPLITEGKDVIGLAETGTGKTAAFLLPLIEKTAKEKAQVTLILTPTRELALQAEGEFRKFGAGLKQYSTTCVGGTSIRPQIRALARTNQFIIGTPGRVLDLIERKIIKPEKITNVVLDEADRMLDMGFIHDMRKILAGVPKERQTLFFSATMTDEAERLVNDFMRKPVTVSVKKKDVTNSIAQDVVIYEHVHKFDTLLALLAKPEFKRVIIFGAMKHSVEKLANELSSNGVKAESIHGNKSHGQRQRSLSNFKSGQARILVATDVAARGIHVDNVTHVINYDLPNTFEDYVHRIGRTGRGSNSGMALTFVHK
ncbi:MAG: DEAD/DEAH box helicase [Candidatus Pacebacteria bacterium]|nr:DEAD/DEAH box helicase [Candidatus Paceibacterota bacterium]MBP9842436.1 DEAD/DEAH box helicase [Candidatus Paceibacterota bacterium]